MKYVYALLVVLILAVGALTLDPSLVSVGGTPLSLIYPVNQMIAVRGVVAAVCGLVGIIVLIMALVRALMFRKGAFIAVLGVGLLAIAGGHLLILSDRGLDNPGALPPDYGLTHVAEGTGEVTVLSYNTLGGETAMTDIATIVTDNGVDVVVLSETSTANGEALAASLAAAGQGFTVYSSGADPYNPEIESTVVVLSDALGEYRQGPDIGLTWGSLHLRSVSGGPDIIAVHPVAPVRGLEESWRSDIERVYAQCGAANTIMAGDFNSTIDHLLATGASCQSALDGYVGGYGTWPASVPGIFGSPIDNVFTDWTTKAAAVVEVGNSDHRGVLVRLSR